MEQQSSLRSGLGSLLRSARTTGSALNAVLLTRSPSAHLFAALGDYRGAAESLAVRTLELALQTSEDDVASRFAAFLASGAASPGGADAPRLLLVQCDPLQCCQTMINHARLLCEQQRALWSASTALAAADGERDASLPRHVVFVVHLPPGTRKRERAYAVDLLPPWTALFVDDIRPDAVAIVEMAGTHHGGGEAGGGELVSGNPTPLASSNAALALQRLPMLEALGTSPYELVASGRLQLGQLLHDSAASALCISAPPELRADDDRVALEDSLVRGSRGGAEPVDDDATDTGAARTDETGGFSRQDFASRLGMLRTLLARAAFHDVVERLVRKALSELDASAASASDASSGAGGTAAPVSGLPSAHVRIACNELQGQGSLRQRLHRALLLVATRAYGRVLHALDTDFNLATLARAPGGSAVEALWLAAASAPGIVSTTAIARTLQSSACVTASLTMTPLVVLNNGRDAPLRARYPFSSSLARLLEAPTTRDALLLGADLDIAMTADDTSPMDAGALGHDALRRAMAVSASVLGRAMADASDAHVCAHGIAGYVHDFIELQGLGAGSARDRDACVPYAVELLRACGGDDALSSPTGVHVTYWAHAARVHRHLALTSSRVPATIRAAARASLARRLLAPAEASSSSHCSDDARGGAPQSAAEADARCCGAVIEELLAQALRRARRTTETTTDSEGVRVQCPWPSASSARAWRSSARQRGRKKKTMRRRVV